MAVSRTNMVHTAPGEFHIQFGAKPARFWNRRRPSNGLLSPRTVRNILYQTDDRHARLEGGRAMNFGKGVLGLIVILSFLLSFSAA